jgi:hypothetical protein
MTASAAVFGIPLATYTFLHVLISLIGIGSGAVVLAGLVAGKRLDGWTAVFLATTVATSVTGYGFPFEHLLPSHVVGFISLIVLAVAIVARYAFQMRGAWRRVYVVTAMLALYLNVFVGVVQSFLKIPFLKALAPKQTELPFVASQGVVLLSFLILAVLAAMRFRADLPIPAARAK